MGGYDDEEEGPMGYGYDGDDDEEEEEFEPNARMAMGQLRSMAKDIMDILSEITPNDYLEPWVAAKITMSKQNLSAVADYLQYNDDYSEGTYDFKRCVSPGGVYYGVGDNEKCVPPNKEAPPKTDPTVSKLGGKAREPKIPDYQDWEKHGVPSAIGGRQGVLLRRAPSVLGQNSGINGPEWFRYNAGQAPNSYNTLWRSVDNGMKWEPYSAGV